MPVSADSLWTISSNSVFMAGTNHQPARIDNLVPLSPPLLGLAEATGAVVGAAAAGWFVLRAGGKPPHAAASITEAPAPSPASRVRRVIGEQPWENESGNCSSPSYS